MLAGSAPAAEPNIPRLDWQPRSDWLNVKTNVTSSAVGDGRADDTAALDRGAVGKTIYLPLLTKMIPRSLWPNKPDERFGNDWARRYGYLRDDYSTSYNLPWLPEQYMILAGMESSASCSCSDWFTGGCGFA